MFRFYAQRLNGVDEADNVIADLVRWSQESEEDTETIIKSIQALTIACLGALALSQAGPDGELLMMAAIGFFVLGVLLLLFSSALCTVHCELAFDDGGALTQPRGSRIVEWMFGPRVIADHREIATIQIQETEVLQPDPNKWKRYEVWIYFQDGGSMSVAGSLYRQQAHKVAVLLEQALRDTRSRASQSAAGATAASWGFATVE